MTKSPLTIIYTTVPNENTGKDIARQLLEEKLIACANILPYMTALYRWDNSIQCDNEAVLLLKTSNIPFETLEKRLTQLHPYDTPCIFSLNSENVSAPYLSWLQDAVSEKNS